MVQTMKPEEKSPHQVKIKEKDKRKLICMNNYWYIFSAYFIVQSEKKNHAYPVRTTISGIHPSKYLIELPELSGEVQIPGARAGYMERFQELLKRKIYLQMEKSKHK